MADWKKSLGWTATTIGALLLVVIAGGVLLLRNSGFHHYLLARIVRSASESTGAQVELQNFDFRLKTLTAHLYGLTVHGTEGARDMPLLRVEKATVGIKIISILHRK